MALRILHRNCNIFMMTSLRRFPKICTRKYACERFTSNKLYLPSRNILNQEHCETHFSDFSNRLLTNHLYLSKAKFSTTSILRNSDDTVNITYIDREEEKHHIIGKVGDNVMYLAQKHDLDVEGACEASLACCTCHVYVETHFDKLNEIDEEEEDMLDLAPFLQENSRLSCQIILSKDLDGIVVRLPSATRNFYVDGHKPKPH